MPTLSTNKMKKSQRPGPLPHSGAAYPYPSFTSGSRGPIPPFSTVPVATPASSGPPITIPLSSPLNPTSLHKILYKKKLYPTAAHLFEAQKFLKHSPELAERIRTSGDSAAEMSMLSRAFQADGMVRVDWELVWRDKVGHDRGLCPYGVHFSSFLYLGFSQIPYWLRASQMDEVLYMKFTQHPNLRAELMATGYAQLFDGNEIRQPDAEGVNELGKALVRLRERLRREGAR
jgi:predicted NAD-dependent protein-ADP-ribosyltransferase YbiA (DUF1768 family)